MNIWKFNINFRIFTVNNITIITTLKIGTMFLKRYCIEKERKDIQTCFTDNSKGKTYFLIRDPFQRLLAGLYEVFEKNSTERKDAFLFSPNSFAYLKEDLLIYHSQEWLNKFGYKMFTSILNKYYQLFIYDKHLNTYHRFIEDMVNLNTNAEIVNLEDLDYLLISAGVMIDRDREKDSKLKHSSNLFKPALEKALQSSELNPHVKGRIDTILNLERQPYQNLKKLSKKTKLLKTSSLESIETKVILGEFGDTSVISTLKVGSQYIKNHSSAKLSPVYISVDRLSSDFNSYINNEKAVILIRDPYERLLSGLHTCLSKYKNRWAADANIMYYTLIDVNGEEKEIGLNHDKQWLDSHGHQFYTSIFNKYWNMFSTNVHLAKWHPHVEKLIERYPTLQVVELDDLTTLAKNKNVVKDENKHNFKNSKSFYQQAIKKSLESGKIEPSVLSSLSIFLKHEVESYNRLLTKVKKIKEIPKEEFAIKEDTYFI